LIHKAALESGLVKESELRLNIGRDHFAKKSGNTDKKSEPIVCYVKP
jgi:hypothetical protein